MSGLAQFIVSFEMGEDDSYKVIGTEGVIEVSRGYDFRTTPGVRIVKGTED